MDISFSTFEYSISIMLFPSLSRFVSAVLRHRGQLPGDGDADRGACHCSATAYLPSQAPSLPRPQGGMLFRGETHSRNNAAVDRSVEIHRCHLKVL